MHYAAFLADIKTLEILKNAGADMNAKNID
jgi:hypothetical protein